MLKAPQRVKGQGQAEDPNQTDQGAAFAPPRPPQKPASPPGGHLLPPGPADD